MTAPSRVETCAAGLLFVALLPLLALLALAVMVESGRPVLVKAPAVARPGDSVNILVFRTTRGLQRTHMAILLLRTGLVSLPQLWNVARGRANLSSAWPGPGQL